MQEIWRDVVGYEDYYQVSNFGRVRSVDRFVCGNVGQPKKVNAKILKQVIRGKYMAVRLSYKGKCKSFNVHRLVANAFIDNPNNFPCVNHKDENKMNNNSENLEWCSYLYNSNYGDSKKKISQANKISHLGLHQPKLQDSNKSILIILENNGDIIKGAKTASLKYNISASNIIQCCKGKRKSAGKINNIPAKWRYY